MWRPPTLPLFDFFCFVLEQHGSHKVKRMCPGGQEGGGGCVMGKWNWERVEGRGWKREEGRGMWTRGGGDGRRGEWGGGG